MNTTEFFQLWTSFIASLYTKTDLLKDYQNDKKWTEKTIGESSSTTKNSPFGNYVIKQHSKLEYRSEDNKIDLAFALRNNNFSKIMSLNEKEEELNLDSSFYPQNYDIIVEHENSIDSCWQEMMKFIRKLKKSDKKTACSPN